MAWMRGASRSQSATPASAFQTIQIHLIQGRVAIKVLFTRLHRLAANRGFQHIQEGVPTQDADPAPGSSEADELDVLALLVERYEREQFPIDPPGPIEAIKFRMEQQGLRKKDLVPFIGSAPKVTEVLNGNRTLSLNMIRKLNKGLGIPLETLTQEPTQLAS